MNRRSPDAIGNQLDIDQLPHVVNYELPNVAEDYIHRIGRTGRAGNEGEAMSLVCVDELKLIKDIERLIKRQIPQVIIDGFEPDPSIKAEPINKGRGKQQQSARKPAGKKAAAPRNSQRPHFKGRSNNQGRSQQREHQSSQAAR